jgi:hypothetical protein
VVGFALFFWGSVTWFVVNVPDWMLSYFIPATELPMFWVHALFAVTLVVSGLAGHTITAACLQRSNIVGAMLTLAAGLAIWGGLWALTLDRYLVVGTYQAFVTGHAVPLQASAITSAMNVVGVIQGLVGAGLMAWLFTKGRSLRAR